MRQTLRGFLLLPLALTLGCISIGGRHHVTSPTMADEIEQLRELAKRGLITQEEFELGKQKLLTPGF